MESEPSRIGLAVSALGGVLTAFAVYQPFYGLAFTPAAINAAGQQLGAIPGASQYAGSFTTMAAPLAGHDLVGVSAHQAFHVISVVLLVLAGAAILVALFGLASSKPVLGPGVRQLLLAAGAVGAVLTVFRMVVRPVGDGTFVQLSLRPGAYLALVGCLAIAGGALWPAARHDASEPASAGGDVWSDLSGWTPS
jgi:hypothetical protein